MALYQCYLWQKDGRIAFCEHIDAAGDRQAIDVAQRTLAQYRAYATVELWEAMRLVLQAGEPIEAAATRRSRYPTRGSRLAMRRITASERLTLAELIPCASQSRCR